MNELNTIIHNFIIKLPKNVYTYVLLPLGVYLYSLYSIVYSFVYHLCYRLALFLHSPKFYSGLLTLSYVYLYFKVIEIPLLLRTIELPWYFGVAIMLIFYLHAFDGFRTVIEDYVFSKPIRTLFVFLLFLVFAKSLYDIVDFYEFLHDGHNEAGLLGDAYRRFDKWRE